MLGVLLILSSVFPGCVAFPVHMSPEVQAQPGLSADHTFIKTGQTRRQEVLQRLGWADAGLNEKRLFWARYRASSRGTFVIPLIPVTGGGNAGRNWSTQNLLVEFDEQDVALRVVEKVKEEDVVRELVTWSRRSGYQPANPASIQKSFAASTTPKTWGKKTRRALRMRVNGDYLEFFGEPSTQVAVSRDSIVSLKMASNADVKPSYTLTLRDKTPWGREIDLGIDSAEILPVLPYLTPKNR